MPNLLLLLALHKYGTTKRRYHEVTYPEASVPRSVVTPKRRYPEASLPRGVGTTKCRYHEVTYPETSYPEVSVPRGVGN